MNSTIVSYDKKRKRYYVVSDVHSFYYLLRKKLDDNGFDPNNGDVLIVNGDLFDRGKDSVELFNYVKSLGDNFIYVLGNHEDLLDDCLYELSLGKIPSSHHFSNGTIDTIAQFSNTDRSDFFFANRSVGLLNKVENSMKEVCDFIHNKAVDYFEIGNKYIITHCWVPLQTKGFYNGFGTPTYTKIVDGWDIPLDKLDGSDLHIHKEYWRAARWGNPFICWKQGFVPEGKIIVSGHWHCSWGHSHIDQKLKEWPEKNRKNW